MSERLTSAQVADIRARLAGIADELTDLAMETLRRSIEEGGRDVPLEEKRMNRARRAVEKAAAILADPGEEPDP